MNKVGPAPRHDCSGILGSPTAQTQVVCKAIASVTSNKALALGHHEGIIFRAVSRRSSMPASIVSEVCIGFPWRTVMPEA